jgi:hypothetical protein
MKNRKLPLNSEGIPSRNELTLSAFAEYCISHPEQRFFQALTNFMGFFKIGYLDNEGWQDLWYMEEGVDYIINKK